jgi:sRNA-binding protein
MPEEKEEKKDFVVKDRRIFAEENLDKEEKSEEEAAAAEEKKEAETNETDKKPDTADRRPPPQFPEINFPTFIASLNASALLQLGAIEDPTTGTKNKNLPMAKQTIDILSMLQEKTTGNLSQEEENLLKNILYDLRLMYVKEKQ